MSASKVIQSASFLDEFNLSERDRKDYEREIQGMDEAYTERFVRTLEFRCLQPDVAPIRKAIWEEQIRIIKTTYLLVPNYGTEPTYLGKRLRTEKLYGELPKVKIDHLTPGLSKVRVGEKVYTFLGHSAGGALLQSEDGLMPVVDPASLDEAERIHGPIAYPEFLRGYSDGWNKGRDHQEIGTEKLGKIPSDYSRGFVSGHRDGLANNFRANRNAPYNEVIREGEARIASTLQAIKSRITEGLIRPGFTLDVEIPAGEDPYTKEQWFHRITLKPSGQLVIEAKGYDRIWLRRPLTEWLGKMDGHLERHFTLPITHHGVDPRAETGTADTYTFTF